MQIERIMKKYVSGLLALVTVFAVSCKKEMEAPVENPAAGGRHTVTIRATYGDADTRTTYVNDKTFSWVETDSIYVTTLSPDGQYIRIEVLYAESAGAETVFSGEIEDGYTLDDMAFYTATGSYVAFGQAFDENDDNIYYYLPSAVRVDGDDSIYYTVSSENPLENLPLIGVRMEDGSYQFQTAAGAAKFQLESVPEGAVYFALEGDVPLSGFFTFDDSGVIRTSTAKSGTYERQDSDGETYRAYYAPHYVYYHFQADSDGKATLYIPLPVGEVPAGTTVTLYDQDFNALYSRQVKNAIPIERNKVTEIATLKAVHEWVSLGKAQFIDNYMWNLMSFTSDKYVEVEVFQDSGARNCFKLSKPYGAAATAFKYTVPFAYRKTMTGPDDMILTIQNEDRVSFETPHNTGMLHPSYKNSQNKMIETQLVHPGSGYLGYYDDSHNTVIKYQDNGLPAQIQLAPIYWWIINANTGSGNWTGGLGTHKENNLVRVIFPGCTDETYDLEGSVVYKEIVDNSPAQAIASVSVYLGVDVQGGQLVIAASYADAKAALASGIGVTEITASGTYEVNLPANAPTGDYTVYLKTRASGSLAEGAGMLYESEPFRYFNASDDRQLQLSDVIGTWTDTEVEMYFNPTIWDEDETNDDSNAYDWQEGPFTVSFTLEESDDAEAGQVMLTAFSEDGVGFCGVDTPIYGSFDSAHGLIVFEANQPIYSFTDDESGTTYGIVFEDYMNDSHEPVQWVFELSEDKTTLTQNYEYFTYSYWNLDKDSFAGYSNIVMYDPQLTKGTSAASPAAGVQAHRVNPARLVRSCDRIAVKKPVRR